MPEILGAATALFGGGAAAGTAAAATTAAVGVGAGSTALTILQGVASAFAAIGAIGAANSAATASFEEADQVDLQAGQEKVEATQRQTTMRRELARILGENDVAFAAGGVDVSAGGGIAEATANDAKREAAFDMGIDRDQDEYRRALLKVRSRGLRRRGGEQQSAGLMNAVNIGLGFGMDVLERG